MRFIALFSIALLTLSTALVRAAETPVLLENNDVRLEIEPTFGTIARILDKSSGINLAPPSALAENFRLAVISPDGKTVTTILGKNQKLSGVSRTPDGIALSWNGPLKDAAGKEYNIAVRLVEARIAANSIDPARSRSMVPPRVVRDTSEAVSVAVVTYATICKAHAEGGQNAVECLLGRIGGKATVEYCGGSSG